MTVGQGLVLVFYSLIAWLPACAFRSDPVQTRKGEHLMKHAVFVQLPVTQL